MKLSLLAHCLPACVVVGPQVGLLWQRGEHARLAALWALAAAALAAADEAAAGKGKPQA